MRPFKKIGEWLNQHITTEIAESDTAMALREARAIRLELNELRHQMLMGSKSRAQASKEILDLILRMEKNETDIFLAASQSALQLHCLRG